MGQSPAGLFGSLALHGLIIAATLFTFSHRLDIVDESAPVVPVDLVTLSSKTNVRASVRVPPKIVPEIKPTPAPPAPERVQAPAPAHEDSDTPPPPDQAPSEPLITKTPPPPIPMRKPQEKPKKAEDKFDLDKVDALLNKVAPVPSRSNARATSRTVAGVGDQTAMTADLVSMLLSQIKEKECWVPPVGAPHPEDLIVDFDVILNPDGSVARVTQLPAQSGGGTYFRAAADAARRAIFVCSPFKLPQDRYSQWREINPLRFDPRQMMGD